VIFTEIVPGNTVDITVAAKGGGSENKSKMYMLNPSDSVVDWVLKTVPTMGAGWCPPGMLGIGIGGTAEKAVLHGQGKPDGRPGHVRAAGQGRSAKTAAPTRSKSCAWSCLKRSTPWALAPKAWAA
jgi:fumarate hydratase class I